MRPRCVRSGRSPGAGCYVPAPPGRARGSLSRFQAQDGVEIHYEEWGSETSARPLVLLHHGFMADARLNWLHSGVVEALVRAGRRVAAPDARGHGRSGKPHDPALYGEPTMARDLLHLADRLEAASFDLVGYSMGAIVCLLAASQDVRVRRLVVGGVGAGVVELGGVDTRTLPNLELAAALEAEDPAAISHPAAAQFRAFADAVGADRKALAAQARAVHASKIPLDRIQAPTLILAGDVDPLAARPEVLLQSLRDARLQHLSGDHMRALADPRLVPAIVGFLD